MRSSPADPATALAELTRTYDLVFEALGRDDLERAGSLLQESEALLEDLQRLAAAGTRGMPAAVAAATRQSQGRALTALQEALARAGEELGRVRHGRRAMQGYGNRAEPTGQRLRADG